MRFNTRDPIESHQYPPITFINTIINFGQGTSVYVFIQLPCCNLLGKQPLFLFQCHTLWVLRRTQESFFTSHIPYHTASASIWMQRSVHLKITCRCWLGIHIEIKHMMIVTGVSDQINPWCAELSFGKLKIDLYFLSLLDIDTMRSPWASYQIHKIAGFACTGNAENVFPATGGKGYRHASRHVRHARAVMYAGIIN